jgi:hypothetical protein
MMNIKMAIMLGLWLLMPAAASAQLLQPAEPQPKSEDLKPGLAVCYMSEFVRHINEMVELEGKEDCVPGKPLMEVNSSVGAKSVLTSSRRDGVLAKITGMIHLDEPGTYAFVFESNDGVRLEIGDYMVVEDPDVHSDQWSDIGYIQAEAAGWYPLTIRYFERKSTSTIRLYWQKPGGEGTMPLVPPDVLAHVEPATQ